MANPIEHDSTPGSRGWTLLDVLTDPVYSKRVSPFRNLGTQRIRAPGLPFAELPKIHVVLVSHNHYDHVDIETLIRLEETHSPRFITSLGNRAFLREFGLRAVDELDWWQNVEANGATLTLTPAQHWSSRRPRNRNRTLLGRVHGARQRAPCLFCR
jgi:L-ascorbate metabolism protein UlaG (beta-lactamase superfamily)